MWFIKIPTFRRFLNSFAINLNRKARSSSQPLSSSSPSSSSYNLDIQATVSNWSLFYVLTLKLSVSRTISNPPQGIQIENYLNQRNPITITCVFLPHTWSPSFITREMKKSARRGIYVFSRPISRINSSDFIQECSHTYSHSNSGKHWWLLDGRKHTT